MARGNTIPAEVVAAAAQRYGTIALDGQDVYWLEGRPLEGGRNVIVRRSANGTVADATPPGANVRSSVQEFGGAAYAVAGGTIYFSEFTDQRLYRLKRGHAPQAMTPAGRWRYADASIDRTRGRLVCVREDHTCAAEAVTTLVSLPLDGAVSSGDVVASGYDFYSTPRFSPDGSQIAWLCWRHPQMPWDGTELWLADVAADGAFEHRRLIAGDDDESIFQPEWSPDGVLHFVSDRTGWWNLYRWHGERAAAVYPVPADCGRPQWSLGMSTYAFAGPSTILIACAEHGRWNLRTLAVQIENGTPRTSEAPCLTELEPGDYLAANDSYVVVAGSSPESPDSIVRVDRRTSNVEVLSSSGSSAALDHVSRPIEIQFPTTGGLQAYAFYYPPGQAAETIGESTTAKAPRLIVTAHGGPTGAARTGLNLEIQFWTSRGFAVADVNYGGSSGYGRAYRERLNGQWGIVDVDDLVNAARYLVSRQLADPARLVVRGRSAGGFTTLAALTSYPDVFAAGASYYGVGDLELLAHGTHKFESRYLDRLVGPYPECRDLYRARSPIHHIDRLACPLIVFQGLDDTVVPPEQAEAIVAAVRAKGLPVEYHAFPGEGHGFRKAETIVRCLEAEERFYRQVL